MGNEIKLKRDFPYQNAKIERNGLTITTVMGLGKIMLQRSNPVGMAPMEKVAKALDMEMPSHGRVTVDTLGRKNIINVGPTMWDITCPEGDVSGLIDLIRQTADTNTIVATDMTDQLICLDLQGAAVRDLFSRACSLDLRDESFAVHQSARCLFAQANVILWREGDDKFKILFDTSLWNYLWDWISKVSEDF